MLPAVSLTGGLVFEPNVRTTARGTAMVQVRLACERQTRGPDGQYVRSGDPCYITVVCWGQMAENLVESVRIGDLVMAQGYLNQRVWDDEAGVRHTEYEVAAEHVAVCTQFTDAPTSRARADREKAGVGAGQGALSPDGKVDTEEPPF